MLQGVSPKESWTETLVASVINVACWFLLNEDFSCPLFCPAAPSRLSISFSRCTYWGFEGISTDHHHRCCCYRFIPKGLAINRGTKRTFAHSYRDRSLFPCNACCHLPYLVCDGAEYWSWDGRLSSVIPSIPPCCQGKEGSFRVQWQEVKKQTSRCI